MAKFKETVVTLRGALQELINETNVDKIASMANTIDALEAEYDAQEKATQEARDSLVKYVKEYAFKEKAPDTTGTEEAPSLDDAIAAAFEN